MAIGTNVARTIKNGTLKFKDATLSVTADFEAGELSGDLKKFDFQPVLSRGVIKHFIQGDDMVHEGSLTCHVTEFIGTTAAPADFSLLTKFQVMFGSNDAQIGTTGLAGEPETVSVELTIADPDAVGSETITWTKCVFPSITLNEGYPSKYTFNWLSRGGKPTIVYSAT